MNYDNVTEIVSAYTEAALFFGISDDELSEHDMSREAKLACVEICEEFIKKEEVKKFLNFWENSDISEFTEPIQRRMNKYGFYALFGHDIYMTQARQGAGFWDTDRWPAPWGGVLTAAAHELGEASLYMGDDGLIHMG